MKQTGIFCRSGIHGDDNDLCLDISRHLAAHETLFRLGIVDGCNELLEREWQEEVSAIMWGDREIEEARVAKVAVERKPKHIQVMECSDWIRAHRVGAMIFQDDIGTIIGEEYKSTGRVYHTVAEGIALAKRYGVILRTVNGVGWYVLKNRGLE